VRASKRLQHGWTVSASAKDAALAATRPNWAVDQLEYATEPDNHPQRMDLADALGGLGPKYGRRDAGKADRKILAPAGLAHGSPGADDTGETPRRVPSHFLSYAKQVAIPHSWAGHTVRLLLDNTRYHVTVQVNGRKVAGYVGGLEPHRIDITRHVTPGEPALLLITVGDSGVSGHRRFDPYDYTGTRLPTCDEIENNLTHPVIYGGSNRAVGQVTLEAVPPVRTEYVFADPKVARGVLVYTVALRNDSAKPARVRVRSRAVGGKQLVDETVTLGPRSGKTLRREIDWPDATLWDLDAPHLYTLKTTLSARGRTLDTHTDTFGFREFTINGHSFYLNGRKIHLHGQSGHTSPDSDWMTLDEKIAYLRAWKDRGHVTHFRVHARPQHKEWVIAADRVGMLVTTETALWTTNYHSFDWAGAEEACYRNVSNHFLEALVRRDRNNPSVVIWSLSNEMSPITRFDLELPKMAAMTRVLERILARTRAEDASRVVQMSSAVDFLGKLDMYNLHYPKNWQAFPDYPHTAYWLDGSFLFPWYGPAGCAALPSWSWRKDKPLYFGEFTCVFGATPDRQASIVGDVAFERDDFGTMLANEKLWPLEIKSYRRLDVSGFCAWALMFHERKDVAALMAQPHAVAHTTALRPLAVLEHTYRTQYLPGDEIARELSIHNDTRHPLPLSLTCEVLDGRKVLWTESMPEALYGPAENKAFTCRLRAPDVAKTTKLRFRATLRSGRKIVDRWTRDLEVRPRNARLRLPASMAFYDPDGAIAARLRRRGIRGGRFLASPDALARARGVRTLWLHAGLAKVHDPEWATLRAPLDALVRSGGVVVIDHPTPRMLAEMPVAVANAEGFAPGGRLELTYAFNAAPHHGVMQHFSDADFSLWGEDYYVARRAFEVPQEGNAVGLLLAGTAESGLIHSPLIELALGRGSYLVSALEILEKLDEAPVTGDLLKAIAAYRPARRPGRVAVAATDDTLRVYREVGLAARNGSPAAALNAGVALIDGERLADADGPRVAKALRAGRTVYLHGLSADQTRALLRALRLPGRVVRGTAAANEYDTFRHTHALADGMSNNYLYWIVDKALVPMWTRAPLHGEPATARIRLRRGDRACQITRRGAVTIYRVGKGTLVIDHLRWQLPDFDEPQRPRSYVGRMLTNLGVPLSRGAEGRAGEDFETDAERRERGHF